MAKQVLGLSVATAVMFTTQALTFTKDSIAVFDATVDLTLKPLSHAFSDLQRDWYKTIGIALIQNAAVPGTGKPWAGGGLLQFAIDSTMPRESFTLTAGSTAAFSYLNVTGADTRGLIYAMYQVSGDILGVDPFWWFLDLHPSYAGTIDVDPSYAYASGPPAFYSRGAFFNDEDISGFFFTDATGDSVYSAHAAERYAETMLRLRANTVIPSTFAYVDERHYRAFQDRGLAFGNHHVMPTGVNTYAWPLGVPYTYRLNPIPLRTLWADMTEYQQLQAGREMIYSVGYRGLNDYPFWNDDTQCDTDQCRGQTISEAIANQTSIALSTPVAAGMPAPRFVSYMWMELLELREAGTLVLPKNVSCIWTDFPGSFNILGIVNATAGDGFYAHLAMMSGVGGQLTEFVKPSRAFENMWAFWMKNATAYGMINVSDLKHIPLTAEAIYKYMWNPAAFNATHAGCAPQAGAGVGVGARSGSRRTGRRGPVGWWPMPAHMSSDGRTVQCDLSVTPEQAQDAFILSFTQRHYGSGNASDTVPAAVAAIHGTYFNASYMAIDGGNNLGDHYFGTTLRSLIGPFETDVDSGSHSASLATTAQPLLTFASQNLQYMQALLNEQVLPLQASVPSGGPAGVYAAHVTMQVALHAYHILAFQQLGEAALAWVANDIPAASANLSSALASIDTALDFMRLGEGNGVWRGVYAADYWTWVTGTRAQLSHLLGHLNGAFQAIAPPSIYPDYAFMTYECPVHDGLRCNTFPLSSFNASIAWDVMVRVTCAADAPPPGRVDEGVKRAVAYVTRIRGAGVSQAASCTTGLMGVSYTGPNTNVALFTAFSAARGVGTAQPSIRYTLDGTAVGPSSTLYAGAFPVTGNATVRARAFDGSTGTALVSESLALITQTGA